MCSIHSKVVIKFHYAQPQLNTELLNKNWTKLLITNILKDKTTRINCLLLKVQVSRNYLSNKFISKCKQKNGQMYG